MKVRRLPILFALIRVLLALLLPFLTAPLPVLANPLGGVVSQGAAAITSKGPQLTVKTSGNTFINWSSFNINPGETTSFVQPSSASVVWNKINDPNASQILGTLNGNGLVVLQNSSGFYIGGQAVINVGGLVMTTTATQPPDLAGSGAWEFSAPPPTAKIINYGQINGSPGAPVFLIAHDIENHGTINSPGGKIGLYAGKEVMISTSPDGRGLSAKLTLPEGSVDNSGKLIADAGTLALHAQTVNQSGVLQANSVREVNGKIEVLAGDLLNLASSSQIQANGDSRGVSSGGQVTLKSENQFTDQAGSAVNVAGGAQGGNGGTVEVSAPNMSAINSQIDGHANSGFSGGRLQIDPTDINLNTTGTGSAGTGVVTAGSSSGTLNLNVNSAFTGFSLIDLQATHDITLANNTIWDLNASTGISTPGSQLILEAGNNVNIGTSTGASILAGTGWSVTLEAGRNFNVANTVQPGVPNTAAPGTVTSGTGTILLAGNGTVQTQEGSISLLAGNTITVQKGAVRTMNDGNIDATAVFGDINANATSSGNTATTPAGYDFGDPTAPGYHVDNALAGISTAAGGNVNLSAGRDVIAFLPPSVNSTDAGSGAFGSSAGNVIISAGRNVIGHFVVANGTGTITAGLHGAGNAGTAAQLIALSLVKGIWNVNAPHGSIALQEVRNPNGVFNHSGAYSHVFDYDSADKVVLNAFNGVEIAGVTVPRVSASGTDKVPLVYPQTLQIIAGAGGVQLDNSFVLFPSATGNLDISTSSGGSLFGQGGKNVNVIMSDSAPNFNGVSYEWIPGTTIFSASSLDTHDHAPKPLHLTDPQLSDPNYHPVDLNISGNILSVGLGVPVRARIQVVGNMDNSSFLGENLSPNDVTSITIGGRLYSRNQETFDELAQPLPADEAANVTTAGFLNTVLDANGNPIFNSAIRAPQFTYVAGSGGTPSVVGIVNRFTPNQYQQFVNTDANGVGISLKPMYLQLLIDGVPQFDLITGAPIVDTANPVNFLNLATVNYLYQNSQDVPATPSSGYALNGPGKFNLTAGSVDLGSSPGINSQGAARYPALANYGNSGADINLTVTKGAGAYQTGDLTMFSSTISTWLGGGITILADGAVNVGSQNNLGGNGLAQGIYTLGPGNINVTADGTIDVAGSRIATFNGGTIDLLSKNGNVNAGNGAQNDVNVTLYQVDPITHAVLQLPQVFSGSGIIAYTLPINLTGSVNGQAVTLTTDPNAQPGNINITTPNGSIFASLGGIVQEPLNGNLSAGPEVNLSAGTRDAKGNPLTQGNIDVSGSGVIGGKVSLDATGSVAGLVIGRQDTSIKGQSFAGTLLTGGNANVSASGSISGTIIGVGGISVGGGGNVSATLLSQSVSVGTGPSSSTLGGTTASATSTSAASLNSDDSRKQALASADNGMQMTNKLPQIARLVGRVTVLLPR